MASLTLDLKGKHQIPLKSVQRTARHPPGGALGTQSVFLPPGGAPRKAGGDAEDDPLLPPRANDDWFEDRTRDIRAYNPITGLDMESPEELNERLRPTGLARHRLVNAALEYEFKHGLHMLAIAAARTPAEADARVAR